MSVPATTQIDLAEYYNVVKFCEHRANPLSIKDPTAFIQGATGLSDLNKLNVNLRKGNYIPVLVALWSEKNALTRLKWLRSKHNEFHAPLMFEEGIAEFIAAPTVNTIITTTFPLSIAAAIRIDQDTKCFPDPSIRDLSTRMRNIYNIVLDNAVKEYCKPATSVNHLLGSIKAHEAKIRSQVLKLVNQIQIKTQPLPSPNWVAYHGLTQMFEDITMHLEKEWKTLRIDFAKLTIKTIEKEMQTDESQSKQTDDLKIDK